MMRRTVLQILLLSVAFALASLIGGWWVVPLLGAAWGVIARNDRQPELVAATAAGLGWSLLLIWAGTQGPILALAGRAGGVMGISGLALLTMAISFSVALAWSAAVVARAASLATVHGERGTVA